MINWQVQGSGVVAEKSCAGSQRAMPSRKWKCIKGTCWKCKCLNVKCEVRPNIEEVLKLADSQDVSEVQMYNCEMCKYQSKHKEGLKDHLLVTRIFLVQMHKCQKFKDDCELISDKYKASLKATCWFTRDNQFTRTFQKCICITRIFPEVQMYNCKRVNIRQNTKQTLQSTLQTKHKGINLKSTHLVHKDISEVQMYQCNVCKYQTKQKGSRKRHLMLVHKDISEVQMYKCEICEYQSKQKDTLKSTYKTQADALKSLIHKISEMQLFNCQMCEYQTKHKGYLKRHSLIHRDVTGTAVV
ncbi:hypothetical protein NQ317_016634 [Molorchus minor]|uniref:C2H2-type domain-containing protein n=1 Tax=Molorchus minor TaxID=1323400 RepID=A0ABQ9IYR6_9CUCU|nr:hypothetical protein NQ317_016634 [Molorchus minor]